MDPAILAAIIGGVSVIVAALVALVPRWPRRGGRQSRAVGGSVLQKNRTPPPGDLSFRDPEHPTRTEIGQLANYYGLFRQWTANPHLAFMDGDVTYWWEQALSAERLCLEFESRRAVLEEAEKSRSTIPSQGDLSALAQQWMASHREPSSC